MTKQDAKEEFGSVAGRDGKPVSTLFPSRPRMPFRQRGTLPPHAELLTLSKSEHWLDRLAAEKAAGVKPDKNKPKVGGPRAVTPYGEGLFRNHGKKGLGAVSVALLLLAAGGSVVYWQFERLFPPTFTPAIAASPTTDRALIASQTAVGEAYARSDLAAIQAPRLFPLPDNPIPISQTDARPDVADTSTIAPQFGTIAPLPSVPVIDAGISPPLQPQVSPPATIAAPPSFELGDASPESFSCPSCEPLTSTLRLVPVFLHIARALGPEVQQRTETKVMALGIASFVTVMDEFSFSTGQVRYFHPDDAASAQELATFFAAELVDMTWYAPRSAGERVELWVAADD